MDNFIDCMDFEDKKWSMDLSGYFFWFEFCYTNNTSIRVIRFKSLSVIRPCLRQPFFWKTTVFSCFFGQIYWFSTVFGFASSCFLPKSTVFSPVFSCFLGLLEQRPPCCSKDKDAKNTIFWQYFSLVIFFYNLRLNFID